MGRRRTGRDGQGGFEAEERGGKGDLCPLSWLKIVNLCPAPKAKAAKNNPVVNLITYLLSPPSFPPQQNYHPSLSSTTPPTTIHYMYSTHFFFRSFSLPKKFPLVHFSTPQLLNFPAVFCPSCSQVRTELNRAGLHAPKSISGLLEAEC